MVDYEAIQHVPLLREAWVLSFRGLVETTSLKNDQQIPFFMLPALGGGSDLRAFSSWRFRDRNSLLLQAEWRVMVNRFLDMAVFYDAGKVTAQPQRPESPRLEDRRRFRISVPWAAGHAAAYRLRAGQRKASPSCSEHPPFSEEREACLHIEHCFDQGPGTSIGSSCASRCCCACSSPHRVDARRRVSIATTRSRASRPAAMRPASSPGTSV